MLNRTCALVFTLGLIGSASVRNARADEDDDRLARRLVAVVRDPRLATIQRTEAAKLLTQLGPRAAAATDELEYQLTLLRRAEQEPLQEAVVEALGAIGTAARNTLPTLARTTGRTVDIDLAVRQTTKQLVDADPRRDLPGLIAQLRSADVGVRLRAVKTLGSYDRAAVSAVPALTRTLSDTDGDVRRAAITALKRIAPDAKPSKELIAALVLDLSDADDAIRLAAVRALGKLGPAASDAATPLQTLTNDPDKDVRKAAADALVRILTGG